MKQPAGHGGALRHHADRRQTSRCSPFRPHVGDVRERRRWLVLVAAPAGLFARRSSITGPIPLRSTASISSRDEENGRSLGAVSPDNPLLRAASSLKGDGQQVKGSSPASESRVRNSCLLPVARIREQQGRLSACLSSYSHIKINWSGQKGLEPSTPTLAKVIGTINCLTISERNIPSTQASKARFHRCFWHFALSTAHNSEHDLTAAGSEFLIP